MLGRRRTACSSHWTTPPATILPPHAVRPNYLEREREKGCETGERGGRGRRSYLRLSIADRLASSGAAARSDEANLASCGRRGRNRPGSGRPMGRGSPPPLASFLCAPPHHGRDEGKRGREKIGFEVCWERRLKGPRYPRRRGSCSERTRWRVAGRHGRTT
jgi:hypothetical protein